LGVLQVRYPLVLRERDTLRDELDGLRDELDGLRGELEIARTERDELARQKQELVRARDELGGGGSVTFVSQHFLWCVSAQVQMTLSTHH
jgi:hypothetical protein